jgi:PIF1-like helicase/Helitron helicase-like domain at N-terminus
MFQVRLFHRFDEHCRILTARSDGLLHRYFTQYASHGLESSTTVAYIRAVFTRAVPIVRRTDDINLANYLGLMDIVCPHCSARFFKNESFHCCSDGAVELPLWRQPPAELSSILCQEGFRSKIRAYNCAMSLASSVFTDMTPRDAGPATFKMGGRSWRLLPKSLEARVVGEQKFAQIYSMPVSEATDRRTLLLANNTLGALNHGWLESLHTMLLTHNPLVRSFVQSYNSCVDWNITIGSIDPEASATNDSMVGLLLNGGSQLKSTVVPMRGDGAPGGPLIIVPDLDPYYQPLHFVLLFPFGDPQWGTHLSRIKSNNRKRKRSSAPVSINDYLKFHVQRRTGVDSADCSIHEFARLFEEWFVDCFLQSENHKLKYLQFNQSKFRNESRVKLRQQLHDSFPPRQIGSPATHLPSSFIRGHRHCRELYADAMTLPAKFGSIDYFLTFTTNPSWPEILENTKTSNGMNSPDLYCRVFHMKMNALLYDVLHNGILGVVVAYTYAVEFQHRGLPHLHALFFVRAEDKPRLPADVDKRVAAQLPDAILDPDYFQLVVKHMIHGPCGCLNPAHYCMRDGECRFDYPKRLQNLTTIPADGYTQLARPFGRFVQMSDTFTADNSWVVPHNKYLLCKYNAHINVECSASITVVQYVFSYVYKGTKTSSASVKNSNDEIRQFSDGRITSAAEAIWSVLGFSSHAQSPTVQRLGCNLPEDPYVEFNCESNPADILIDSEASLSAPSHLKSWFELNRVDAFARTLLYVQIPEYYTWNSSQSMWCRRKSTHKCLGRLYPADFSNRERWALRTLLQHARGCKCADDLRTVCHELKPTFWDAAVSLGLFDDDAEYRACLSSLLLSADQLRNVFRIILIHCHPKEPMVLINEFFQEMTSDFVGNDDQLMQQLLQSIENCVDVPLEELGLDRMLLTSLGSTRSKTEYLDTFVSNSGRHSDCFNLNPGQQLAHDNIITDAECAKGSTFTLMASAGTGKTYLISAILNTARQTGLRVVTCASSALAASLLGYSRTAHSLFKIPINIDEHSHCKPSANYKNWLRSIQLFIWDEISMAHKWALDSVDRLLRDLHNSDKVFGGVTMVLSGDMRQLLPVQRFAPDPAAFSLLTCSWFANTTNLFLNQNMRSADDVEWSEFVASIGNGCHAVFPAACVCESVDDLIAKVWPDGNFQVLGNRSILTLTREDARSMNLRILDAFPGEMDYAISKDAALVSVTTTLNHALTTRAGL